ncbi:MAG TPA: hypothetical protein VLA04_06800 [Verrucomicrobiae bacterium]|nr:hypothetical protein [Verrucomicrobiae bacterium]
MMFIRALLAGLLAEFIAFSPVGVVYVAQAAASPTTPNSAEQCVARPSEFSGASDTSDHLEGKTVEEAVDREVDPTEEAVEENGDGSARADTTRTFAAVDPEVEADPGEGEELAYQSVNLEELKKNPFFSQENFDKYVKLNRGWFDTTTGLWNFCSLEGMEHINSPIPFNADLSTYFNKLGYPYDQIVFKNPTDKYAVTGEPCTLFDPRTKRCDETKESQVVTGADGKPLLDEDGKQVTRLMPKYYDDSIWPNEQWDAPKADLRILKTLVYLTTPKSQGGAGRERIKVAKILQPGSSNREFNTSEVDANEPADVAEPTSQDSAHAYDLLNPSNPQKIATAVDISEIDKVRITTRITQKRRLGGSSTSYQYKEVPLKVAWQTDKGVESAELVGPNMYKTALSGFSLDLASLLDDMDLEAEIDLSAIEDLSSFGDIAELIGQSILTQLINSPNGSLKGWDFPSVLENLGRAYLSQQLGLPAGALSQGTTVEQLIESVGRNYVETAFGFPANSLTGKTSAEVFANLGRRELEGMFGVSDGTLLPLGNVSQDELLARLGAGKIEQRLKLPQGSLRSDDFAAASSSPKSKILFAKESASFLDEALNLAYQEEEGRGKSAFGFTASDYEEASSRLLSSRSNEEFRRYKRLVGSRVLETSLGKFTPTTASFGEANPNPQTQNFIETIRTQFGFKYYPTQTYTGAPAPANETIVYQGYPQGNFRGYYVITIPTDHAFRTSGAFSDAQLNQIAEKMLLAYLNNTFGTSGTNGFVQSEAQATELYNAIMATWRPLLQNGLTKIDEKLRRAEENRVDAQAVPLQAIRKTVSVALGQARSYSEGLLTMLNGTGQSGRSAAAGLPANFLQANADGTLTGTPLAQGDPINAIMGGNLSQSLLSLIGKAYVGSAMTEDAPAVQSFISQIGSDLTTFGNLDRLGIGVEKWVSKGFSSDDFDRIFTKDLGPQVFQRIGEQELLRTVWAKSGLQKEVNKALGSSDVNNLINQVNQVAQGLEFYSSRYKELQGIGRQLEAKGKALGVLTPTLENIFKDLNSVGDIKSIAQAKDKSKQYEPLAQLLSSQSGEVKDLVGRAQFIAREIAAGHPLSLDQSADSGKVQGVQNTGCWSPTNFRQFLSNKGNLVNGFVSRVAACRVDDALSLPLGSAYKWYELKDFSYEGLTLSIGRAYADNTSIKLSDAQARSYGEKVLESAAIDRLLAGIPGLSSTFRRLGFKGRDIHELLTGNTENVLRRVGGSMMDGYFNWEAGTASQIIEPQCPGDNGKMRDCTRNEAADIRLQAMANMGLKELGITLNFPSGFDLLRNSKGELGAFNFATNFGIARISESLGLKENSFYGSFSDVRGRNTSRDMLQGFGWYDTPPLRELDDLKASLRSLIPGLTVTKADDVNRLIEIVEVGQNDIRNAILDEISKASSDVWKTGSEDAIANELFNTEKYKYESTVSSVKVIFGAMTMDPLTKEKVNDAIKQHPAAAPGDVETFKNQISAFKTRVNGLDGQFGATSGTFKNFLTGTGTGQKIAEGGAQTELLRTLADGPLRKALEGTPFAELVDMFQVLSKSDKCPSGVGLGDFLINKNAACGIQNVALGNIFSGKDVDSQVKRAFLYDNFLARGWAMELEKDLKVQPGTMRAIAIEPWRAKEIAIDQGVRLLGNELFKLADLGGPDTDENKALLRTFHSSLMAGFCPVDPLSIKGEIERELVSSTTKSCSFRFETNRSLIVLSQQLNTMLEKRFTDYDGGRAGSIGLVDLLVVGIGGMDAAYFLGAQQIAQQLNSQLGDEPNAEAFKINYADIRNAFGQFTLTEDDYSQYAINAQADFARNFYSCSADGAESVCDLSDADVVGKFLVETDPEFSTEARIDTIQQVGATARIAGPAAMKRRAASALQYNFYDILAFKTDPNIPRGFSYALLQGSQKEKYRFMGLYLVNKLNLGESVFGGALSNEMVGSLLTYVQNGYRGSVDLAAVNALDDWFGKESEKLFGVQLPAGVAQGIFAWGTTGFAGNKFDSSSTFNVGGKEFQSVGTVLKGWGINKILSWADTGIGLPAGSAFQIYQAAADVAKASNFLALAQTPVAVAKDAANNITVLNKMMVGDPAPGKFVNSAQDARVNLRAAQVALVTTIITIVFASQIAEAEQSLGLVPGTGAMGLTMLIQLAMGVPVDPITLGLFLAINLFGVYKVEVTIRATVDGYYPITGQYGVARTGPAEYKSADPPNGTFDAKSPTAYREGLKAGARFKVNNFLQDLLLMPERWAPVLDNDPNSLWIAQVYTGRVEDTAALDGLISRPAPWDNPAGLGYGELEDRATILFDKTQNKYVAHPKEGYRAGYFAGDSFSNTIHLRW